MTQRPSDGGWFASLEDGDRAAAVVAIREGRADEPADWPTAAVAAGVADDADAYYDLLAEASLDATRAAVEERERADDQQLVHAVRALEDCERVANELRERATEWGATLFPDATDAADPIAHVAAATPTTPPEERAVALAERVRSLEDEAAELRTFLERAAPAVAPNLAALAGPVLAARLIALAGGLEDLARKPSGTLQVLGAEDALFAHLRGDAPSPKHGVIYTHEYVRGAPPGERGSASRALAGKLAIAARVDHYSGDRRPSIDSDLEDRMARIHARDEG